MPRRRPGRPAKPAISREQILRAALVLLETEGLAGVSMRALARRLRVDPMALYHYVADRDALLAAAAALVYGELDAQVSSSPASRGSWQQRLTALAEAYLELLARSGELLRYLSTNDVAAAAPTELFAGRFNAAVASLELGRSKQATAHDVFVDFVHGFALGVPRSGLTPALRRRLHAELAILYAGIAAR